MTRTVVVACLVTFCMAGTLPASSADEPASMVLRGRDNDARDDVLKANAVTAYEGETVRLFRMVNGVWVKIRERPLDARGNARFEVDDHNDASLTKYLAKVRPTDPGLPRQRAVVRVR
jgi:hypothetical protein